MSYIHVCMGALPDCKNVDSYGVICVECNLCGRFDPPKQEKQDKEEMTWKRKEYLLGNTKNVCLRKQRAGAGERNQKQLPCLTANLVMNIKSRERSMSDNEKCHRKSQLKNTVIFFNYF